MSARPSWDEYFIGIATQVALRATCLRKKVGAVLVRDHVALSCGYNGSPAGQPHCLDAGCEMEAGRCVRSVHAEINAVAQAAKNGTSILGATIYTTASPCYACAKVLVNAGVRRVVFGEAYRKDGRCDDLFARAGIEVVFLASPVEKLTLDTAAADALAAAHDPNTPPAVLEKLANGVWEMRKAVARNPNTPPAVWNADGDALYAVAGDPSTPPVILERLSGFEPWDIREAVAGNPSTPPAALEHLASDRRLGGVVCRAVARNPSTPPAALEQLAGDERVGTRLAVASNPSTPQAILNQLADDVDADVRKIATGRLRART